MINTTWENLQIAKHKSVRWAERTPNWFVLYDLQIFSGSSSWGSVDHLQQPQAQSLFSISNVNTVYANNSMIHAHKKRLVKSSSFSSLDLPRYRGGSPLWKDEAASLAFRSSFGCSIEAARQINFDMVIQRFIAYLVWCTSHWASLCHMFQRIPHLTKYSGSTCLHWSLLPPHLPLNSHNRILL